MDAPGAETALLLAKLGSMLVLGLGSLLLGVAPLVVGRCRANKSDNRRAITSVSSASTLSVDSRADSSSQQGLPTSLLLCFGGGVLLFTTFLHLAPEVRASVEAHQRSGRLARLGTLSLAELLFCAGFFFVYLVEEAVHALLADHSPAETLLYRTVSVRRCNNNSSGGGGSAAQPRNSSAWRSDSSDVEEAAADCPQKFLPQEHARPAAAPSPSSGHSMRSLLTVLALSFHAIFEGLAVGLEPALASVLYLAAAIATHKLVISFCVGMELYVAGASNRAVLGYLSVFSMVTPMGIGLGLALGHLRSDTLGPTPTILQGMAAGTLLYVVFFEVLARERANDKSGLLQLAAILLGFTLMLGLQIATGHSHDHEHEPSGVDEKLAVDNTNYIVATTINGVTEKIAQVLSTTLT